jgi:hypothetical protein
MRLIKGNVTGTSETYGFPDPGNGWKEAPSVFIKGNVLCIAASN